VSIAFGKVTVQYQPQDTTGNALSTTKTANWDRRGNPGA
jgi:hypothetical protein